jgi:hypothetical protein
MAEEVPVRDQVITETQFDRIARIAKRLGFKGGPVGAGYDEAPTGNLYFMDYGNHSIGIIVACEVDPCMGVPPMPYVDGECLAHVIVWATTGLVPEYEVTTKWISSAKEVEKKLRMLTKRKKAVRYLKQLRRESRIQVIRPSYSQFIAKLEKEDE